jgi:mRNA interferase RelE/StbE
MAAFCGRDMKYEVHFKPRAGKDLRRVPQADQRRIIEKIEMLCEDLKGDVKKLTDHTPEYRLRVGRWRVLFEIEGKGIIIYRIIPRAVAYR